MGEEASFRVCARCGSQIPADFMSCPSCQSLVHSDELKQLSRDAAAAEGETRVTDALAAWRRALELLPPGSRQALAIQEKITLLGKQLDSLGSTGKAPEKKSFLNREGGKLGILGLIGILLSKLKILLLGLGKLHTLITMLLAFGVYWSLWGWPFALGFVLSIYVHEMGHVAALVRYGIKATSPMFIPGIGAFVRLNQTLVNPREDARVGLAGPIWGLGAALAAYGLFWGTQVPVFAAIARTGAWINLFNLMPVWQLDGGRGFHSMSTFQRWIAVLALAGMWAVTKEGLLLLLLVLAVLKAFEKNAPEEGDTISLVEYAGLVIILSMMCKLPVPGTSPM